MASTKTNAPWLLCALGLVLSAGGCGGAGKGSMPASSDSDTRPYLLETVGEYAVSRVYADGFEELSKNDRALAFYLYRSALAGRDIFYDQMGRDVLEIRDLLEEILIHPQGIDPKFRDRLLLYLKLFWINNGNHNDRTRQKFVPEFTFEDLQTAAGQAQRAGAKIKLAFRETLQQKLDRLRPALFDPRVDPLSTCKSPPPGGDILTCSSVNFQGGVSLADLKGFQETHPLNSRLVKKDGKVIEEVYRAGRGDIPPGRYAKELKVMVGFLEKARPFADEAQGEILGHLIDYFATGDPAAFRAYNIAWVKHETPVDAILGFIETYKDPRGQKGAFEGIVHFVDRRTTRLQKDLANLAQHFEDRAPWDEAYKRKGFNIPIANAVKVLHAAGDSGPMPPIGVNLPNEEDIRERYGNKSVSLVNVMDAHNRASHARVVEEFFLPEDRALEMKYGSVVDLLQTTMHEVLGHASGKVSAGLKGDPREHLREYYSALEEARAELIALYNFFDPKLIEIGALPSPEAAEAAYRDYVTDDLYNLRRVRQGDVLEDDHMRATHLIVSYIRETTHAVETVKRDGKTFYRVNDMAAMRAGVADLLKALQRIKGEGDYEAARALTERYAVRFDPVLRDEVVARAERASIPSYVAFVMPDVVPVRDVLGNVVDARVEYTSDFTTQMLRYSGKAPLEDPLESPPPSGSDR